MANTMQRFFRHLRGKSKPQLSPDAKQLLILFNQLADERSRLLQDLHYALETIDTLDTQLAEYDCLLEKAQARLLERTDISKPRLPAEAHKPQVKPGADLAWIEDTWLCSCQNAPFLREAEDKWKDGRPQHALITASRAHSNNPPLKIADKMKCQLFIAALVHYGGKHEESNERVDSVLRMIQEQQQIDYAQAREVCGIAYFIQGKNLMGLEQWHLAYWAFSKALYTPGYHSKAQSLQKEAIANCQREAPDE